MVGWVSGWLGVSLILHSLSVHEALLTANAMHNLSVPEALLTANAMHSLSMPEALLTVNAISASLCLRRYSLSTRCTASPCLSR